MYIIHFKFCVRRFQNTSKTILFCTLLYVVVKSSVLLLEKTADECVYTFGDTKE